MDAPQPQKERGQPAGRPPTTWARPSFTSAIALRCEITRCSMACCSRGYAAILPLRICGPEKSQGMVTLHSDTLTDGREGRASEALDEITRKEATSTRRLCMQDSICEACPKTSANKCEAKIGSKTADSCFRNPQPGSFAILRNVP